MKTDADITNSQQVIEQLARRGSQDRSETSVVTSPGARVTAWVVKVKSLSSYNVYNVRLVEIGDAGSVPVEVGGQMQAVNLAESFTQTGQLSAGTYVAMSRVGDKNVFYAPV
jgi:hypothetical protein